MLCEKHGPRDSTDKIWGLKAEFFVGTEARGPSFSHGMGDHGPIIARSLIDFPVFYSYEYEFYCFKMGNFGSLHDC